LDVSSKNLAAKRLAGMLMLLYSAFLAAGLAIASPWWLLRMATTDRYRQGLGGRLGRVPERLRAYVAGKQVIWIHAVSVGEVLAASRLVAELEEALVPDFCVVVSTTTRTGQALAGERFGAARVFYFPLDFGFAVRAYLRALRPAALVLIESEVWPRMMHECRKIGTPVVVVNARVSDRSFQRSMAVRWIWSRVLRQSTLWLAQSEEDARRLVAMGARAESVSVGGNLKYDVRAPKQSRIAELIKDAAAGRPIVVAGSTVESEEELLLTIWKHLLSAFPNALLILAPRHPERFDYVLKMIRSQQLWYTCADFIQGMDEAPLEGGNIVLLNTIGDLAAIYRLADVAFIGGSLVQRGGHNPLEPAQFSVPVVMGFSFENFRDIVGKMQAAQGIFIVENGDQLEETLIKLLMDPKWASGWGERGRKVFEAQQGATKRAVDAIVELVKA
jgi:3-deoxy-D-manno-octulosonic-acid transferase